MVDRRAADREAFFAGLPPNEFTPLEASLRQALLDLLRTKPGPFPLIEWIDRRLGGEIQTSRDESGQGEITLIQAGGNIGNVSQNSAEAFFAGLPGDAFTPEEEALRESIFDFLASWKSQELANLSNLGSDRVVQDCRRALMPPEVSLADWIERRIGGEVELRKDAKGQFIIHLTPAARPIVTAKYEAMMAAGGQRAAGPAVQRPREGPTGLAPVKGAGKGGVNKEAWFASLPTTELTREEVALRQALLDWLRDSKWRHPNRSRTAPALLAEAMQEPEIARCIAALLPPGVPVREWIDRRVGGEIELRKDEQGQFEIMIRGSRPAGPAGRREEAAVAGGASIEAFFSQLPDDELTPEELTLRQAVLDFLESQAGDAAPPLLSDASKDRLIREARAALLPAEVPLRMWIDRRIGGEVEVTRDDKTQFFIIRLRRQGKDGTSGAAAKEENKEKFFEALPADRFTEDEEKLRESLLHFLESWKDKDPPTLSHAGSDPEIRKHRALVLPKGVPVSMKEWIDRRMGGEIEMVPDSTGQLIIGIRGELDLAAAARKRKAESNASDIRGKGQRPGGKPAVGGPGSQAGSGNSLPAWKRPRVPGVGDGKGSAGRPPMRG